ncbi:hypothetical protein H2198_008353 [Neophaeococcomyces mojaviensis]|uniref:Uncharacterized protein n=1 Tax=Neophaeococcomyces mojaviensis TaxID=3383035 RepID=A0ACC2ZXR5_9EURO|nr:hypothetical protein H2198_008353 [Knufia sp. JES_112]
MKFDLLSILLFATMAMAAATGQKRANGEGDDYDDYDGGRDEWDCKPMLQSCTLNDECCSNLCVLGICT